MKDSLMRARVVVGTASMKISRLRLADYVTKLRQRESGAIPFPHSTSQGIDLWSCRSHYRRHFLNSLLFRNQLVLSRKKKTRFSESSLNVTHNANEKQFQKACKFSLVFCFK